MDARDARTTTEEGDAGRPIEPDRHGGDLVAYRSEDGTVICDRKNPAAWIRSDVVVSLPERV